MKKYYLMAPGPTPIPPEVLQAIAQPIIHHRTPEYEALFGEVRAGLKALFQTKEEIIPFAASGSGAMEAAVVNTLSPGDKAIVIQAGKFGERWGGICKAYGIQQVVLEAPYGQTVPAERIEEALKKDPSIKAVFATHSETSTGVLHDIESYAKVTRNSQAILVVDAVSSLGVADLPMDAWGVDVVVAGSQKGLMLPPGLGLVAFNQRAWERSKSATLPKFYFNMATELKCVVKNQVNFTPAVSIVLGLKVALDIILKREGLQAVFKRHDRLARATRAGVEALGLTLFARARPSPAITAVEAPKGIDGEQVLRTFGKSHNITIAGGQGEMQGKVFRLGHMGYVGDFDVIVALSALELVLAELGVPADLGAGVRAAEKILAEVR